MSSKKLISLRQIGNYYNSPRNFANGITAVADKPSLNSSSECPFVPKVTKLDNEAEAKNVHQSICTTNVSDKVKPFNQIPTPKGLPIFGTYLDFFRAGGGKNLHFYSRKRHSELGPLYREVNSSINVLFVGDPSGMQDIYKHETNTPAIFTGTGFTYFNQIHNCKRGLFFMVGEEWRKYRTPVNNLILKKRDLSELFDKGQVVLNEQFSKWGQISTKHGCLPQCSKAVYEAGVRELAAFFMGRCFDTYRNQLEADVENFHEHVTSIWKYNMKMHLLPPKWAHKLHLPLWKNFEKATFSALAIGPKWVDHVLNDKTSFGSDGLIHMLLNQMEESYVKRIIGDLIAGSDTESIALTWLIFLLGRHPEAQEKIFEEITRVSGSGKEIDHRDLEKTEYLRACVKEVLRLYPVPVFTTRFLQQDAIVMGYHVPAGTMAALNLFAAQRNPYYFPEPDRFWPERWLRTTKNTAHNSENDLWDSEVGANSKYNGVLQGAKPYMSFGWGTRRGCVFRKVSLVRMHLFIGRMIQEFKFTCDDGVKPTMISVMVPDRDLNLKLTKRN